MSDRPRRGLLVPVLVAGVLSLLVSLLRLYGELQPDWPALLFGRAAGGGMALVSIALLVPIFGFWFGRRLAAGGSRPPHAGKAMLLCLVGFGLVFGVFALANKVITDPAIQPWVLGIGTPLAGLTAFLAWRAAWFTCVVYGFLARIPVILIQQQALARGWDVHYAKAAPNTPPDQVEFVLTMAQVTFWPLAFTTIVGGLFAALGSLTVRKQG